FHSSQLPLAHLCPPQSDLLPEVYFRGTFLSRRKGDIIIEAQHEDKPNEDMPERNPSRLRKDLNLEN
ncbi:MAG: hypothetical protein WB630_17130, partial [Candidatus Acidiferrales bacterium]